MTRSAHASTEITREITEVNTRAKEMSDSSSRVTRNAVALQDLAEQLKGMVAGFTFRKMSKR